MSIDLLSVLEASPPERAESVSASEGGAFPRILHATLGDGERANGSSDADVPEDVEEPRRLEEDASDAPESTLAKDSSIPSASPTGADANPVSEDDGSAALPVDPEAIATPDLDAPAQATAGLAAEVLAESTPIPVATLAATETASNAELAREGAPAGDAREPTLDADHAPRDPERDRAQVAFGERSVVETRVSEDTGPKRVAVEDEGGKAGLGQDAKLSSAFTPAADAATTNEATPGDASGVQETAGAVSTEARRTDTGREIAAPRQSEPSVAVAESRGGDETQEKSDGGADTRAEDHRQDARANEPALPDRATEDLRSAEMDAALRQAIVGAESGQRAPESVSIEGAGIVSNPIAGALTETTPTPTPGSPTPAVASDAIAVQTEWLASRGGGTARLLLSPPSLGEIAIRVTLRGGVVDVVMVAQEAIAKTVAEEQSDRLAQAFSSRDLRLDGFEVRRGEPQDLANEDFGSFAGSQMHQEGRARDEQGAAADANRSGVGGIAIRDVREPSGQPEILSAGPQTGVDLRI